MESRKRRNCFNKQKPMTLQYNTQYYKNFGQINSHRVQRENGRNASCSQVNFRSSGPRKKPFPGTNKRLSPEDMEEEERKKKLSDTANKLLSKIKTWSAQNNGNVDLKSCDNSKQSVKNVDVSTYQSNNNSDNNNKDYCSIQRLDMQSSVTNNQENNSDVKRKRIAHSVNKSKMCYAKKSAAKSSNKSDKMAASAKKYEVNKASVKDFQNRIQHKLINEIMQMPKENLQNMLNNPTINPIMQVKISHLVRENRLVIAQKLRALAESKMSGKDCSSNSQFLMDIDKLIDPVIETDLSVLPMDLIKKMENIFQVQFDYSENRTGMDETPHIFDTEPVKSFSESEIDITSGDIPVFKKLPHASDHGRFNKFAENVVEPKFGHYADIQYINQSSEDLQVCAERVSGNFKFRQTSVESNNDVVVDKQIKEKHSDINSCEATSSLISNEDLTMYECSTDEDDNITENEFSVIKLAENSSRYSQTNFAFVESLRKRFTTVTKKGNLNMEENEKSDGIDKFDDSDYPFLNNLNNLTEKSNQQGKCSSLVDESVPKHNIKKNFSMDLRTNNKPTRHCQILTTPETSFTSTGCQTENYSKSITTQTSSDYSPNILYGVPVPEKAKDETSAALLHEVNSIQNLMNKLNERRFMIFLKLTNIHPQGDFITDNYTEINFIESVTNGNVYLSEMMKNFFMSVRGNFCGDQSPRNLRRRKRRRNDKLVRNQSNDLNP